MIPFYVLVMILAIFTLASIILLYHFFKYRLYKKSNRIFIVAFVVGSLLFVVFEFLIFFSMDWQVLMGDIQNSLKPSKNISEPDILR
jgi:RsiW-degrading membrane proteinase PrsW (M82 family)